MDLDGVNLVAAALSAGVTATAKSAAADAYNTLKSKLLDLFKDRDDRKAEYALELFEDDPKGMASQLASRMADYDLGAQPELLNAARQVLQTSGTSALGPGSVAADVLNVIASGNSIAAAVIQGNATIGPHEPPRSSSQHP